MYFRLPRNESQTDCAAKADPTALMDLRVLPSEKVQLYLLFYKPCSDDPFLNRLVAYFDAPFCHVEMAIPKRIGDEPWDRSMMASSIYQNQTVFFKPKTYDRQGYVSFAIEISVAQLYKIKSFCKHHTERHTPFSLSAMYAAYLPFQLVETDATFCSKHVTQALQFASVGLAESINPSLTTPSNLYKRLVGANGGGSAILQVIPSRMNTQFKPSYVYMTAKEEDGAASQNHDNNRKAQIEANGGKKKTVPPGCDSGVTRHSTPEANLRDDQADGKLFRAASQNNHDEDEGLNFFMGVAAQARKAAARHQQNFFSMPVAASPQSPQKKRKNNNVFLFSEIVGRKLLI